MKEVISKDNIQLSVDVNTWEESIEAAGYLLIKTNKITHDYVESMINSVHEMGPYMVLMPGFALVHAAPSSAVHESAISLITIKNPVSFNSPNDPVKVVLCLACIDKTSHMDNLQVIAEKLMVDNMVEQIYNCKTTEELYQLINL
ncbi:MAG: PTS sugar transporter subunit IIA [Coprobacillus sp.]